MATAAPKRGIESVLLKLQKSIEQGDYYAAQQMYKTLHFRYSAKRQHEDLVQLLTQGALLMLQHGQVNEGSELALLLVQHYKTENVSATSAEALAPLLRIFAAFPASADPSLRRSFVKAAVSWSSHASNHNQGAPALHDAFAAFYASVDRALAEKHYLRGSSDKVADFAKMLLAWADEGYPSERDLFLARAVLQYLCLSNLKDARALYTAVLASSLRALTSPLVNFLGYLLQALQHDAYPLLVKLRQAYAASLQRDPNFTKYLDMIGKIYFNVEPPSSGGMGGIFGSMMRSFMGGDL